MVLVADCHFGNYLRISGLASALSTCHKKLQLASMGKQYPLLRFARLIVV